MKKTDDRAQLFADIDAGLPSLRETSRRMRKSIGMTQFEYAKLIGIAPRVLIDFERGVGNPTFESLSAIGAPFGLELAFRRKR